MPAGSHTQMYTTPIMHEAVPIFSPTYWQYPHGVSMPGTSRQSEATGPVNSAPHCENSQQVSSDTTSRKGKKYTFSRVTNLTDLYYQDFNGSIIADALLDPDVEITDDMHWSAINFALDILKEENDGKLNLGVRKVDTLHKVAQSIVETFPRMKSPIRQGENKEWEHVSDKLNSTK